MTCVRVHEIFVRSLSNLELWSAVPASHARLLQHALRKRWSEYKMCRLTALRTTSRSRLPWSIGVTVSCVSSSRQVAPPVQSLPMRTAAAAPRYGCTPSATCTGTTRRTVHGSTRCQLAPTGRMRSSSRATSRMCVPTWRAACGASKPSLARCSTRICACRPRAHNTHIGLCPRPCPCTCPGTLHAGQP